MKGENNNMYDQIIDYILNSPESTKRGEIKYLIKKAYKNDNELWSGTMAQDLIEIGREDAVTVMENGYYGVYYDRIDVNMILKN